MSKNILIDYDCLQDTRLGVLNLHSPEEAIYYLDHHEEWVSRETDCSKKIDPLTFALFYKERADHPEEVLAVPMTPLILMINKILEEHAKYSDARFYNSRLGIHVNTYPYLFSPIVSDLLRRTIFTHLEGVPVTDVTMVSLRPKDITPDKLVNDYPFYYTYSLEDWLEVNGNSLVDKPVPLANIIAPRIYKKYNKETINKLKEDLNGGDVFDFITKEHAPLISLSFLTLDYFSFLPVPTQEEFNSIIANKPKT